MMAAVRGARDWIATVVLAVVLSGAIAGGFGAVVQSNQRADALERDLHETTSSSEAERAELVESVELLRDQVRALGEEPIVDEPDETPAPREDEPPPVAVSAERVRAAVQLVLAADPALPEREVQAATVDWLQANPPADGEDARPATPEELAVQVAAYCATGACRGEDGEDAPPVTDEQLAVAVATYCNDRGECRGETGPAGPTGPPGPSGPPGPACPEGYVATAVRLYMRSGEAEGWADAQLCLPEGETPTPDPTAEPTPTP